MENGRFRVVLKQLHASDVEIRQETEQNLVKLSIHSSASLQHLFPRHPIPFYMSLSNPHLLPKISQFPLLVSMICLRSRKRTQNKFKQPFTPTQETAKLIYVPESAVRSGKR
jgi:hypothetical protein